MTVTEIFFLYVPAALATAKLSLLALAAIWALRSVIGQRGVIAPIRQAPSEPAASLAPRA
jgi:hypothetical protein